ncbi:hypothetical protein J8281_08320 [Aquimarina sp. U1-2]|uniref:hypothetical protein n=1 Tax=Aquimarina sp. U1-2 TaxID=2823141 RepID=UPI001AEC7FBC|nr:hypothetical protein [Aquimarina sp. U1-2]MBP2832192.1 hypothetical protein [Aquimarina sp. U1-2]
MQITQYINKKALQVAVSSFLLGTIILALYLISESPSFLIAGVFYVLITLVLNAIMFIELLIHAIIMHQYYRENLITIFCFLVNIPIALGYFYLVMSSPF